MSSSRERPLLTIKSNFKNVIVGIGIGVVGIVLIVASVTMITNDKSVGTSLLPGIGGVFLLLWCFFEVRHIRDEEYYYADRVERIVGGKLKAKLTYSDGFRVSYAIAETSGDAMLTVKGDHSPSFIVTSAKPGGAGDSFNPSLRSVEKLRDHLLNIVETQILETVNQDQTFAIDKRWSFDPDGMTVDGTHIAWSEMGMHVNDSDGEVTLTRNGQRVATRYMMDDNVLPALTVIERATSNDAG